MSMNVIAPLLSDRRLELPESSKIAGIGQMLGRVGGALGTAAKGTLGGLGGKITGAAEAIPTRVNNRTVQRSADFDANRGAKAVAPLSSEEAAQNAAAKLAPKPAVPPPTGLAALSGHRAGTIGAGALALKGLADPGETYDENGNPHQKSRIMGALGGAVTGYAGGQLAAPLLRSGAPHLKALGAAPAAPNVIPHAGAPAGAELPPLPAPLKAASIISLDLSFPFSKRANILPGGLDASSNNAACGAVDANADAVPTDKVGSVAEPVVVEATKEAGKFPTLGAATQRK